MSGVRKTYPGVMYTSQAPQFSALCVIAVIVGIHIYCMGRTSGSQVWNYPSSSKAQDDRPAAKLLDWPWTAGDLRRCAKGWPSLLKAPFMASQMSCHRPLEQTLDLALSINLELHADESVNLCGHASRFL